jgi:shikimate dehydrogenase
LSPALHHAAYRELGLDHRYVTIDCPDEGAVRAQRDALVRAELAGLNITVPWKRVALALADEVHPSARRTGAANVWVRGEAGQVIAHNTDCSALADCLRAGLAEPSLAGPALVLGNGGAARAAVVACLDVGARPVRVSARRWQGERVDWEQADAFAALGAEPIAWVDSSSGRSRTLADAASESQLLVQATSAGMQGVVGGELVAGVIPWSRVRPSAFAYDVVYKPARTPFLDAAREHRVRHEGGLPMLVGQAALAIQLWLGVEPSRERMREAADRAIFGVAG